MSIHLLPFDFEIETRSVLKKTATSRSALAELKGVAATIPNQSILIHSLSLQEAKDSSAIENIITTHDELYKSDALKKQFQSLAAKEVHNYASALLKGVEVVKQNGFISNNHIIALQSIIEENSAGFRKQSGTVLKNEQTNEVIYTPPQHQDEIIQLMQNLEQFINDTEICDWDTLIKMAVIHHQFESIHPFYDGNGRTGRILNILFLVKEGLLDSPILYLSRYINVHKQQYYKLLQKVRDQNAWEEWVLFILDGVEVTSRQTILLISDIKNLMLEHKQKIRRELPRVYSQDILNNIFKHPYTKIEFVRDELNVTRQTATRYLEELTKIEILEKYKIGRENYYINKSLFNLLSNGSL